MVLISTSWFWYVTIRDVAVEKAGWRMHKDFSVHFFATSYESMLCQNKKLKKKHAESESLRKSSNEGVMSPKGGTNKSPHHHRLECSIRTL